MYEPNLTSDELRAYYTVLKNSENTATQEEKSRKLHESINETNQDESENSDEYDTSRDIIPPRKVNKPFTPKSWSSFKKTVPSEIEDNSEKIDELIESLHDDIKKPKDATKIVFGYNEMLESLEKKAIKIIKHDLKFIPIQCTSSFLKADLTTKVKILYAYHSKIHAMKENLARQSFFPAPEPKAIISVDSYPSFSENFEHNETYISRSGRQTKRKIYYDENSLDDDFSSCINNKKIKNLEHDWLSNCVSKKNDSKGKITGTVTNNNEVSEIDQNVMDNPLDIDDIPNVNTKVEKAAVDELKNGGKFVYIDIYM